MKGKKERLEELYKRGIIFKVLKDIPEEYVEDVYQDVFTNAYCKLNQLKDIKKMEPWLSHIARNERFNFYKKRKREQLKLKEELKKQEIEEYGNLFFYEDHHIEAQEFWNIVFLQGETEGLILYKHYEECLKYKEIAELLDKNYNTVKSMAKRTKEKLRIEIESNLKL